MRDFRTKIKAYQETGDRTIIEEILTAAQMDFMENESRMRVNDGSKSGKILISLEKNEHYIAYRVRAMRELINKKYNGEIEDPLIHEMQRLLSVIYIDLGIKFNATPYARTEWIYYYHLTPELFEEIEEHMEEIEENMHYDSLPTFKYLFERFKNIVAEMEKEKETITIMEESIIKALEHGFKYVDTSKTEREIVKYVNMAFTSKFSDLELERNGLERIQRIDRHGIRKTLHVKKHFPEDLTRVVLGSYNEGYRKHLTNKQNEFIDEIIEVVREDKIKGELENYTCNRLGEVRINKKYIAEKLGISSATTRKRISRILKRLA